MIGKQMGQYRVIEQLGTGGMGEVYIAEDTRLGRRVALKVLPASMAADPERRMRFEREARAVAKLSHPNIVMLHTVEEADGLHFFTMELVAGKTLGSLLSGGSGLPPVEFARLATQLVEAVAAAHREGVTHRDLKPANVMVTDDGRIKVLDFGLAKLAEPAEEAETDETLMLSQQKTELGQVVGTLAYMSPEQAEGKAVDERSDVFSLGILLHQMATGMSPFSGDTRLSLVSSILKDTPASVAELRPQLGESAGAIVSRCLEKDPARRYASAVELLSDLAQYRQELEASELLSGTHPGISGIGRRVTPRTRGRGGWKIAAAFGAVVVLAVAGWLMIRGPRNADGGAVAPAGERNSLAVFYFQNLTGDTELEWLRTGLTDMLVTDLSQSPDLRVMGTDRLHEILTDMGRETDSRIAADVVQAVARQADVGTAILGSFVKAGETLRISVRVQDVDSGELLASEKVEGPGQEAVFAMVDDLTRQIRKKLALAELSDETTDRDLASVTTESVEAYREYAEGIRLHESGDEESAIPALLRAVELDPGFAMALAKLSVAYGNSNEPDKSREYGAKALELVDRLTARERYYVEGVYYSKDPETADEAIEAYRKAVELYPDHNSARNNLAQIYFKQGRHEEAIVHLERLRADGMTFPGTYSLLSNAYLAVDRPDDAIEVLEEYVANHPENPSGYKNLARLQMETQQFDAARASLERVEELNPGTAMDDLWAVNVLTGRWDEARQAAVSLQGAGENPMRWVGYAMEGLGEIYQGRSAAGIDLLSAAIDVAPDGPIRMEVRKIVVAFTVRIGRDAAALERAERLLEALDSPGDRRDVHFVAAIAEERLGRPREAEEHLDLALASLEGADDESERARFYLRGMFALARGRNGEAIEELLAAEPLLPAVAQQSLEHSDVWGGLGQAYLAQGNPEEAAKWFRKLIDSGRPRIITPVAYVRSYFFLAKCYEEMGDRERAAEAYEAFLDHWEGGDLDRERVAEARALLAELNS